MLIKKLLSTTIGPMLHLSSLHFLLNKTPKIPFRPEEQIDLFGGERPGKFGAIFLSYVEKRFIQLQLILMISVNKISLTDFGGVFIINGPKPFSFFRGEVQSFGDKGYLHGLEATSLPLLLSDLRHSRRDQPT